MPRLGSASKLFILVLLALLLRLAPILATGMPYDNDSWYIHYDVRVLRFNPNARLLSDTRFDGYDNLWPASVLIPYIVTLVAGSHGLLATHIVGPVLDALSIIPFYALASRYSRKAAWLASLLVAASPGMVGIGVGLVKETVARPLFYASILAVLRGGPAAALLSGLGLALTHHLSSFVAGVVITLSYPAAWLVKMTTGARAEAPRKMEALLAVSAIAFWLVLVGLPRLRIQTSLVDPVLASLYILAVFSLLPLGLPLIGVEPGPLATWLPELIVAVIIAFTALKGVPPGIQPVGASAVYYSIPYLFIPYFTAHALSRIKREPHIRSPALALAWLLASSGLIAYLVFGGVPLGQSPAGRLAVFLVPGAAILYAYADRRRLLKVIALLTVVLAVVYVGVLASNADPESYDLAYHQYEYSTCKLLSRRLASNTTVYADAKMRDLLYYLGLGKTHLPLPQPGKGLLVLYKENLVYGYKLDSNIHGGDPKEIARLITRGSLVANNGGSWIVWLHR